jgi:hypothetical protein
VGPQHRQLRAAANERGGSAWQTVGGARGGPDRVERRILPQHLFVQAPEVDAGVEAVLLS